MNQPITCLQRAMWAETTLMEHCFVTEGEHELYDLGESCVTDLIANLCHLLHLDEKTAGCMEPAAIKQLLQRAFDHFESESMGL